MLDFTNTLNKQTLLKVILIIFFLVLSTFPLIFMTQSQKIMPLKTKASRNTENDIKNTAFSEKISVSHVCGAYPNRQVEEDMLLYGAKNILYDGFQGIEVFMYPQNLCTKGAWPESHPQGCYQTYKYCQGKNAGWTSAVSLSELAKDTDFSDLFSLPFSKYILSVDPVNRLAASQTKLNTDRQFTEIELQLEYQEVKEFIKHLLTTYSGTKKTFFVVSVNELDNRLLSATNCYQNNNCNDPATIIPDLQVTKAIKYLDTFSDAVYDARKEAVYNDIQVYHVCEIHDILDRGIKGRRSAINSIIPYTRCDIVAWSAYEIFGEVEKNILPGEAREELTKEITKKGLDYIAEKAPNFSKFGNKNIIIGEVGIAEIRKPERFDMLFTIADTALQWGVQHFNFWQYYDAQCNNINPSNNECVGLWMIKPDGTPGSVFSKLKKEYSISRNNSQYISQKVPSTVLADKEYEVSIIFKNTGNTTWQSPLTWDPDNYGYYLSDSANNDIDRIWERSTIGITPKSVAPNELHTFNFKIRAPHTPGIYGFEWQLRQNKIGIFGEKSKRVEINVQ